ncbi:Dhx29, partial [Symbiodinium sp. CCMP2456]
DPAGGPGSRDSLVGYQIRLEKKVSSSTRLLFCTVGVLLRQLQQGLGALAKVTHIFIDEVHERSADCDLLMLLLRQVRASRPDLCLCLMSATMESDKLVRYFGSPSSVPVLSIPGRTFPVQQFWLEDVVQMTGYRCEEESEFAKKSWNRGWNTEKKTFQVSGDKGKTQTLTAYIDEEEEWGCDDEAEMCDPDVYE